MQFTVATITGSGEGYKTNDVLTNPPVNLGVIKGGGFELQVNTLEIETTVSIDEKEGSITVKELDATEFTIGSALALTASGISKIVAGNLLHKLIVMFKSVEIVNHSIRK